MHIFQGRFVAWLLVVLYIGIIFFLSSIPAPSMPGLEDYDKFYHLVEYALLTFLLLRAMGKTFIFRLSEIAILFYSLLMVVGWGALDELHQWYVPGRDADYHDIMADALGAVIAGGIWLIVQRIWGAGRTVESTREMETTLSD